MRKGIYILAIAATLTAVLPAATAQQADPPSPSLSAKIKQQYLERRARLARRVKDIYFAVGCKIIASDSISKRDAYLASVREQTILDMKEDEELVQAARQAGLDRAAKPGACDYYRRHPEAAEAMQRAAAEAAAQKQ